MSGHVSSATSRSGMVENVGVAIEVSFAVFIQASIASIRLISKYFRFSVHNIRFLLGVKHGLKTPSCSQFISRKSRQGASANSGLEVILLLPFGKNDKAEQIFFADGNIEPIHKNVG